MRIEKAKEVCEVKREYTFPPWAVRGAFLLSQVEQSLLIAEDLTWCSRGVQR